MINDPQNIGRLVLELIREDKAIKDWMSVYFPGYNLGRYLGTYPGDVVDQSPFVFIPTQSGILRHGKGTMHTLNIDIVLRCEEKETIDNGTESYKGYRLVSELMFLVWRCVAQANNLGWSNDNEAAYEVAPAVYFPQFGAGLQIALNMRI